MIKIIPGILEKDFSEIEKKLELIKPFANTVHIDIIDGIFAQNQTLLDPAPFLKYAKDFFMEVHLMVDDPLKYLEPFSKAGFRRFLGHIERMKDLPEFVARGQLLGEVGLAIDSPTSFDEININFDDLDLILIMGVKAGASGQELLPQTFEKIKKIRQLSNIYIEIDGGVNDTNIVDLKNAGANRVISTSFLFQNPNPKESYEKLISLF